jgi:3-hydroxypropanoate dehydrogenase
MSSWQEKSILQIHITSRDVDRDHRLDGESGMTEPTIESLQARRLDERARSVVFTDARSHNAWQDVPVNDATLEELVQMLGCGPTSMNCQPARFVFLRTRIAKDLLLPALAPANVEKAQSAPVTVIIGYDLSFWKELPKLFPHRDVRSYYEGREQFTYDTAFRNSSLQGAYLMVAARMLGLDVGPMSGFDTAKVDAAFFGGTTVKTNFICNLGYGNPKGLWERLPRPNVADICRFL